MVENALQAIKFENRKLQVLNQLALPLHTEYVNVENAKDGHHVISKMMVRSPCQLCRQQVA
jgi:methylthioribose-1-phosphate isomerase